MDPCSSLPTVILTTLSARSGGLSADDVFTSAATVFDPLAFGFARPFLLGSTDSWDIFTVWYPDGIFALYEASAFVGLVVLGLAAIGGSTRRARPWLAVVAVLLALPVLAAFRPAIWLDIPILNGLRSPVRAYLLVAFVAGLLAAIGIGRVGRMRRTRAIRRALLVSGLIAAAYAVALGAAFWVPSVFEAALQSGSSHLSGEAAAAGREAALKALSAVTPLVIEIALAGIAAIVLVGGWGRRAPLARLGLSALAIAPLVLFSPAANPIRPDAEAWPRDAELARTLRAIHPNRTLTLNAPGFYDGAPDRLAASGVADLDMFSSLNLRASDELLAVARGTGPDAELTRRLVGVDTLVTFGAPCPGTNVRKLGADDATVCHVPALTGPYWIPSGVVAPHEAVGASGPSIAPRDATLDLAAAVSSAIPGQVGIDADDELAIAVEAPADGYVWVDRAWWPGWSVEVDGRAVSALRALAGQLVPVSPGHHQVMLRLVPWESIVGLALGVAVTTVALMWAIGTSVFRRRRPRGIDLP